MGDMADFILEGCIDCGCSTLVDPRCDCDCHPENWEEEEEDETA